MATDLELMFELIKQSPAKLEIISRIAQKTEDALNFKLKNKEKFEWVETLKNEAEPFLDKFPELTLDDLAAVVVILTAEKFNPEPNTKKDIDSYSWEELCKLLGRDCKGDPRRPKIAA